MGGVNQHGPGESYSKLYFFYKFNGSKSYIPLQVEMMSLVKYFLNFYSLTFIILTKIFLLGKGSSFINSNTSNLIYSVLSLEPTDGFFPNR